MAIVLLPNFAITLMLVYSHSHAFLVMKVWLRSEVFTPEEVLLCVAFLTRSSAPLLWSLLFSKVKYRDYVAHGCRHLVRHHYEAVFVPFSGRSSSTRVHPDQAQNPNASGGGGAIDPPFLRKHKAFACRATQSCPSPSPPPPQDGAKNALQEATKKDEDEAGDDPQAYGDGACGRCRALVMLADSVTRRRKPDQSFGPSLSHLFSDALETGLCESVGLRFKSPRLLEALCERVLDDHLDHWAATLASYRLARQSGKLPLPNEGAPGETAEVSLDGSSVDGDGYLDEALAARLCGAESADLCTHVEVEAIFEAQKASAQQTSTVEADDQDTSVLGPTSQPSESGAGQEL